MMLTEIFELEVAGMLQQCVANTFFLQGWDQQCRCRYSHPDQQKLFS